MEELLEHIRATWGRDASVCKHERASTHVCSDCYTSLAACCASSHACLVGQGAGKRERDEEGEEGEGPQKQQRVDVSLEDLNKDVINVIAQWLNTQDLRNLSAATLEFNRVLRAQYFRRFNFKVTADALEEPRFLKILPYIESVSVPNIDVLRRLTELVETQGGETAIEEIRLLDAEGGFSARDFPKNTRILEISNFEDPIARDMFPQHLTQLTLSEGFDEPIDYQVLPLGLTHLTFRGVFDQSVDALPQTLTHLTFSRHSDFNQRVENLPQSLTHLTFGWEFNQPVDKLPRNLLHLKFGRAFNQPVNNLRFLNLTHLKFGDHFNQPVDNSLPKSLLRLNFGYEFNQQADNLPKSLLRLNISGYKFNRTIKSFPPNLTHLTIRATPDQPLDILPQTLTHLKIIGKDFNQPVDGKLPPNLVHLELGDGFNHSVNELPPTLLNLRLGGRFNQSLDKLPQGLTTLALSSYQLKAPYSLSKLPNTLVKLVFIQRFGDIDFPLDFPVDNLAILELPQNTSLFRFLRRASKNLIMRHAEGKLKIINSLLGF